MDDDRLSELPDSLILSILSLLDMKDVVRTTILSKRWKNRWTTVPCLRFCFRFSGLSFYGKGSKFVSGALAQWKGSKIREFTFLLSYFLLSPSFDINSWLLFAIEKQVEKLTFGFHSKSHVAYFIPQSLYSCSSITKLSLYTCSFKIERNVQWNQLKRLKIRNPDDLSGDAMNQILVGAPLLEELVLWCSEISENFNIRSTSLKMLEIYEYLWTGLPTLVKAEAELRIWAPNLLSLKFSACICGSCLLYVPSLTTATLSFKELSACVRFYPITREDMAPLEMFHQVFRSIRYVEKVSLLAWSVQFLVDMKENGMPVQFPNVEFLKLRVSKDHQMLDVLAVLEMFPKLKMLIVHQGFEFGYCSHPVASQMISQLHSPSLPHLKTVEIVYERHISISPLVQILLENAHVLEKMVLQPYDEEKEYNQEAFILALTELLEMRRSSPYAKVIIKAKVHYNLS